MEERRRLVGEGGVLVLLLLLSEDMLVGWTVVCWSGELLSSKDRCSKKADHSSKGLYQWEEHRGEESEKRLRLRTREREQATW